jgi:V/A-type H+-transporting ATPase subunit D
MSAISFTRIERTSQIARRKTAQRGHKLLKNKQDEMVKTLASLTNQRDALREIVNAEIRRAIDYFVDAKARMSPHQIDNAILAMQTEYNLCAATKNIMGLEVPVLALSPTNPQNTVYSTVPQSFDRAVHALNGLIYPLVELASIEKTCTMLEQNLAQVRRRINALEYKVIPEFTKNIRDISLRLAENERGNLVRLLKIKELQKQE